MIESKSSETDSESAYGSETASGTQFTIGKHRFTLQNEKKKFVWYERWESKIRDHLVIEGLLMLTLFGIFVTYIRLDSRNEETQSMIRNLQDEFITFQKNVLGKDFSGLKTKTETDNKKIEEMLIQVLKEVEVKPVIVAETIEKLNVLTEAGHSKSASTSPNVQSFVKENTLTKFNAASFIDGATIDTSRSSSSNLNPFFGYDQSSMVLVDRPEPPANKAWCTYEKEPILTVNLAKYVKPTAVSYQHWNGTSLDDMPKTYDVLACLDYSCEKLKPLVLNCEYKQFKNEVGKREQYCLVPTNSINTTIGKVQFHFRRNHGNSERTCVSLVRVYTDSVEAPKEKERTLYDAEECSELKNDYHHNYLTYNYWDFKNCTILYSKRCCDECPECCQECSIKEWNKMDSAVILGLTPLWLLCLIAILCIIFYYLHKITMQIYSKLSSFF